MTDEITQDEKRAILRNDQAQSKQPNTYLAHALIDEPGGRFAAVAKPHVTGSSSEPPSLPAPQWSRDALLVPDEEPLGIAIDNMGDSQ